jgi:hypothetical protein
MGEWLATDGALMDVAQPRFAWPQPKGPWSRWE